MLFRILLEDDVVVDLVRSDFLGLPCFFLHKYNTFMYAFKIFFPRKCLTSNFARLEV